MSEYNDNLNVDEYLERIRYTGSVEPTLETLKALQSAHIHNVPYENLSILNGEYLSLEIEDVYDRIVRRKRGSYCFQMNGLFGWLLRSLGFKVTEYYGRYLAGEPIEMPMRRHRILRVDLDGKVYICDVGMVTLAPVYPLELVLDKSQEQEGEEYRIVEHPTLGFVVEFFLDEKWNRFYCFTMDEAYPIDFEMPNHWCLTHPDSIFKKMTLVFIRTEEGRNTLYDAEDENGKTVQEFRKFTSQGVDTFIPKTKEQYRQALLSNFGIDLDV